MKLKIFTISRIIIGLVFIFSGIVKAIDPWGSAYKFIDYYHDAFHIQSLDFTALPMAFILSALEFITGIALVFKVFTKVFVWIALAFMVIFTPLTLYLAIADPVHDCGCFGDAIVMTNWQTLSKNIIILVLTLLVFLLRKVEIPYFTRKQQYLWIYSSILLIFGFQFWNFNHLPVIDFRAYKIGTYIPDKMIMPNGAPKDEYQMFITLKDTVLNKEIEIDMLKYTNDSTYWGQTTKYKFIKQSESKLVKRGYTPPINNLTITDSTGVNILDSVLHDPKYSFWLVAYSIKNASINGLKKGNELAKYCKERGVNFYFLTASSPDEVSDLKTKIPDWTAGIYITDPITLKTIVRAHPGLVLLKKGTILNKWHFNDFPNRNELQDMLNQ